MKLFESAPDGGKGSGVTAYFLIECKPLFSIALLKFDKGTREAFHSHAFNALTLWLKGSVMEHHLDGRKMIWLPSQFKYTSRNTFHKVEAFQDTWAISIRGPWGNTWKESRLGKLITLTYGRKEVQT